MVVPDLKAMLKEAKTAIKANDFEQVIKCCKVILKHERTNYQALVMFARACQEVGKYEDSKKMLLLASSIEPDTGVAWQGLATLLETHPALSSPQEAVVVYTKLVQIIDSGPKHVTFLHKLAVAQETSGETLAAALTLYRVLPFAEEDDDRNAAREVSQNIVTLLAPIHKTLSDCHCRKLMCTLEKLLNDSVLGYNETNYKIYLALLYKFGNSQQMIEAGTKMASIFRTAYSLEWIARVYVENNLPWNEKTDSAKWEDFESSISRLLEIYPATLWGNLALGLNDQKQNLLESSIRGYVIACERSSSGGESIIWWRLLLEAQKVTRDWSAVETTVARVIKLLTTTDATWPGAKESSLKFVIDELQLTRAEALMKLGHNQHFRTALKLLRKLDNVGKVLIVRCLLQVDLEEARKELMSLKEHSEHTTQYQLLYAQLSYEEKDLNGVKNILDQLVKTDPENAEALVLLGRVHQDCGDVSLSLACLLRAAKLDSSQGQVFLCLGHHYKRAGDKIKASKCYQKAYSLSASGEEEGAALSDIYRELGEHEKNFALLSNETKKSSGGGSWAWLRLGLHHLALHEPQPAISALQRCLQLSHDHRQALESLGDAYADRGSYVAAQKVYERVLTLDPTAMFPRCQIAKIQLEVGEPLTSVTEYRAILKECTTDNVYAVASLGLAQAHVVLATASAAINNHDNTLSHVTLAIQAADKARQLQPNSVSVWKLLGDACSLLHKLPRSLAKNGCKVPSRLVKCDDSASYTTHADIPTMLQLATKCYSVAVQLNPTNASLWHDLGLSFYLYGQYLYKQDKSDETHENVSALMSRSSNCLKKSLSLDPLSSESWNTLGVVCANISVGNVPLAQHCFIRSIQVQPGSSNWTHLGVLYLINNEVQLAHQAFTQAQARDPQFVTCWTGQALIAESVQHYDAADLFRHCCTIGVQPECCMGFAHHVMLALAEKKHTQTPAIVALAADAMLFYSREHDSDSLGLNLAGLCLEEHGMKATAAQLYERALINLTQGESNANLLDSVHCNYGRVLLALGQVDEAIQQLSSISEPDIQSECIHALACLKRGDYETGYTKYMSALHWLAQDHHHKAHVLVALACLQYKFKKVQEAKTLLFESCGEGGGCVAGILALGSLGLVQGDATLINAALNELQPYKHSDEAAHHVAFLTSAHAMVKGQVKEAKNILSRAVLCHPHKSELWRSLSWQLLAVEQKNSSHKIRGRGAELACEAIVSCAAAAAVLTQANKYADDAYQRRPTQDGVTKVLALLHAGFNERALKESQRCLLLHPAEADAWIALAAAVSHCRKQVRGQSVAVAQVWGSKCSPRVKTWLEKLVKAEQQ